MRRVTFAHSFCFSLCLLLLLLWYRAITPSAHSAFLNHLNESGAVTIPFQRTSPQAETYALSFELDLNAYHPQRFRMWADDCLQHFVVNGHTISELHLPYCDWGKSIEVDLGSYLKSGINTFTAVISNAQGSGGFDFEVALSDRGLLLFRVATLFFISLIVLWLGHIYSIPLTVTGIAAIGTALRIFYFWVSPLRTRVHDFEGHLQYIRYFADNGSIPPAAAGWEYHQAPLYYLLAGYFFRFASLAEVSYRAILNNLALFSLCLSLLTLLCGIAIGTLLFKGKENQRYFALYSALFATLPGLIFSATRISNDSLFQFLAFLWCYCALCWFQKGSGYYFWMSILVLTCAWLTKASALPLIFIMTLIVILKEHLALRARMLHLLGAIMWMGCVITAYYQARRVIDGSFSMADRFHQLRSELLLPQSFESFLVFNPMSFLASPFNDPFKDEARRQYFWEYFYRSMFFGEFRFADSEYIYAVSILLLGVFVMLFALRGMLRTVLTNNRENIVMTALFLSLLGSVMSFRFLYPYAVHQDFRFIHLLVVPVAYYIAQAAKISSKLGKLCAVVVFCFCLVQTLFIVRLWDPSQPL